MKQPIIIEVVDKHRASGNGTVTVRILAADTRLPFMQFECVKKDLADTLRGSSQHHESNKLDGTMTT